MAWVSSRWKTLKEATGPRRYVVGAVVGVVIAMWDWLLEKSGMTHTLGIPSWSVGVLVVLAMLVFWLLEYATKKRQELAGLQGLEHSLDELSELFDRGSNKILNARVISEEQLNLWNADWEGWQTNVEQHLQRDFGLRERNMFRNLVTFEYNADLQGLNKRHIKSKSVLVQQLGQLREIIIRHSERASRWRAELQ